MGFRDKCRRSSLSHPSTPTIWSAYVSDQADIDRLLVRRSRGVAMKHVVARFSLAARAALALYGAPAVAQVHVHAPAMQIYSGELFDNRPTVTPVSSRASGLNDNVALDARYAYTAANLWGVQYDLAPGGQAFDLRSAARRNVDALNDSAPRPASHEDERQEVSFVAEAVLPKPRSESRVSVAGIGSLFWAVRNPVQGWRVILPIQPDRGSESPSDVKAWCRAIVTAPIGRAACP
jgi:hypothetical protein